jgi:phosphohistidine swiveling domain-containing protein
MTAPTHPATAESAPVWDPPAPGHWMAETSHHGLRPLSHFLRDAYVRAFESGIGEMASRYGLPLAGVSARLVNGCFYVRPAAVGEGSKPKPPPPALLLKLLVRIHPELRRRSRVAEAAWKERRWRIEVDQWFDHDRAVVLARNLELQSVDVAALDDTALARHLAECLANFEAGMRRNLDTHGGDIIPVGDLVAHGEAWGIDTTTIAGLLVGASPATVETATLLRPVAEALAGTELTPASLDEVRALGPEAAGAVDSWLEQHGWRLVTSDDVDRPALAELPGLQLKALLRAVSNTAEAHDPAPIRQQVPADDRELFDSLVEEARYGHRQRDDIRGLCWNWPGGLTRRALLEAGRRLTDTGRLLDPGHSVELTPSEMQTLLLGRDGADAEEAARRAAARDRIEACPPPRTLGEPEIEPSLDVFPAAMARSTRALMANLMADETVPQEQPLHGVGIGSAPYRARACVVADSHEALQLVEPGDVLVARSTGPSFNSLLPIVGALVVEEGGPMCHAAIVARDFGIPALIGTANATADIPHGATVEVDPQAGVIPVL